MTVAAGNRRSTPLQILGPFCLQLPVDILKWSKFFSGYVEIESLLNIWCICHGKLPSQSCLGQTSGWCSGPRRSTFRFVPLQPSCCCTARVAAISVSSDIAAWLSTGTSGRGWWGRQGQQGRWHRACLYPRTQFSFGKCGEKDASSSSPFNLED